MRNLIGRLNRRSLDDLEAIADAWRIPITGVDRSAVAAQLYREMRDIRAGRDCWERLQPDEKAIVRLMSIAEHAPDISMTIGELANLLERTPDEVRDTAISLYEKGLLAGEGTHEEIPVGTEPRVFLPREIGILFRRVQDEIDAGDISQSSISSLLELLDDGEIEDAMIAWGTKVVPGLETRNEMTAHVLSEIDSGDRLKAVLGALSKDARSVWELVKSEPELGPIDYHDIAKSAGLDGSTAADAHRRREVLAEVESALLVWHMFAESESRKLFAPQGLISLEHAENVDPHQAPPIQTGVSGRAKGTHPYAVSWDLLSLVRDMTTHSSTTEILSQRLMVALWNGTSSDETDPNYVRFLEALALRESLISEPGDGRHKSELGAAWKEWRGRSFPDQIGKLLWTWSSSTDRIEAQANSAIAVSAATWPQFRRNIVVMLAEIEPGEWFQIDDLTRWMVDRDADMLGRDARLATARSMSEVAEGQDRYRVAVEIVVRETIETAFRWFGFVEFLDRDAGDNQLVRTTESLRAFERADPVSFVAPPAGPPLVVTDDCYVELLEPSPLRVWALSAFADFESRRPVPRYRMTEKSIKRALEAGFRLADVTNFLTSQFRNELPNSALRSLEGWSSAYRRVWMYPQLVIEVDDLDQFDQVQIALKELGLVTSDNREQRQVLVRLTDDIETTSRRVFDALSAADLNVQERSS